MSNPAVIGLDIAKNVCPVFYGPLHVFFDNVLIREAT